MASIPRNELDEVLSAVAGRWSALRGASLFVTGATGFYGAWILETFLHANRELSLGARVTALSRDPAAFLARMPGLEREPALSFIRGDVRDFEAPFGELTHMIHAATSTVARSTRDADLVTFDTLQRGTHRALELARSRGAERVLLTSSGAVYGRQPPSLSHTPEEHLGGPDLSSARSAYAEGKRASELMAVLYGEAYGLCTVAARGFAFVGPHLPLDAHFAVGNFIRDGLAGRPIAVGGDGSPYRSYLYASELATWLWVMLLEGVAGRAYNLGSEHAVSISELASVVGEVFGLPVTVAHRANGGKTRERYVPCTERARAELGLCERVGLREAIERTVRWHRSQRLTEAPFEALKEGMPGP